MEFINKVMAFMSSPQAGYVFAALWALSEGLAQIPFIKANSIFQAIKNGLGWLKNKFAPKAPEA